jgi:hypothetical protein
MVTTLSDDTVRWAIESYCTQTDTIVFTCKDLADFFQQSRGWASFVVRRGEVLDLVERIGTKTGGRGRPATLWRLR